MISEQPMNSKDPNGTFRPTRAEFEFETREVMIPMRDGARLHTVFMLPRGTTRSPVLLSRTAYGARSLIARTDTGIASASLYGYDNPHRIIAEDRYIRVQQDVRGKHGSDGTFSLSRGVPNRHNTAVNGSTDTWDTIDWIVKNVPECNGNVGTIGISYSGYEALLSLINPHPALKVSVPMNALADAWVGDDWFHNGAFRALMLKYAYMPAASQDDRFRWYTNYYDDYDLFMRYGSASALARAYGLEQLDFYKELLAHQSYDEFWAEQAIDRILSGTKLKVPTMLVHGLWDQEDSYGTMAVYRALRQAGASSAQLKLVIGPWFHGQQIFSGDRIGAIRFKSDTGTHFQEQVLRPYLAQHLIEGAPTAEVPGVLAFQTGTCRWLSMTEWPDIAHHTERAAADRVLHLHGRGQLTTSTGRSDTDCDEYLSDPTRPVPFVPRPIRGIDRNGDSVAQWQKWLVSDQRWAADRTDVLCYVTEPLRQAISTAGRPVVNLVGATTGSDCDWIVKLIDVYPPLIAEDLYLSAYQLPVAMEIFRARYRTDLSKPERVISNKPFPYCYALPTVNHVFLPEHRIMVQIQSTWFPLYDRNPQTYVENIMQAVDTDFSIECHTIYHTSSLDSYILLRNSDMF